MRVARLRLVITLKRPWAGYLFAIFIRHVWSDGSVHGLAEDDARAFYAELQGQFVAFGEGRATRRRAVAS